MSDRAFQSGDTVSLKSGGPIMTVDIISPNQSQVRCVWHDEARRLQSAWLYPTSLKRDELMVIKWPHDVVPFQRKHL